MPAECVAHVVREPDGPEDMLVIDAVVMMHAAVELARQACQEAADIIEPHGNQCANEALASMVTAASELEDRAEAVLCGYAHVPADHRQEAT